MSINTILKKAEHLETLHEEVAHKKGYEKEVLQMQMEQLTEELKIDIETYIEGDQFSRHDKYKISLFRQDIGCSEPSISELLDAIENYYNSTQHYIQEKDSLSKDLVDTLRDNMRVAKEIFIKMISAFLGGHNTTKLSA